MDDPMVIGRKREKISPGIENFYLKVPGRYFQDFVAMAQLLKGEFAFSVLGQCMGQ